MGVGAADAIGGILTARWLVPVLAALPVVGLGANVAQNVWETRGASEWRIPVTGYDPRDPLRGRYVMFQYVWRTEGDIALCASGDCRLCLRDGGAAAQIVPRRTTCPDAIEPVISGLHVRRGIDRTQGAVADARLWVSEAGAARLEAQLRTRPMVAVARLTASGRLIADRLEPAR